MCFIRNIASNTQEMNYFKVAKNFESSNFYCSVDKAWLSGRQGVFRVSDKSKFKDWFSVHAC